MASYIYPADLANLALASAAMDSASLEVLYSICQGRNTSINVKL